MPHPKTTLGLLSCLMIAVSSTAAPIVGEDPRALALVHDTLARTTPSVVMICLRSRNGDVEVLGAGVLVSSDAHVLTTYAALKPERVLAGDIRVVFRPDAFTGDPIRDLGSYGYPVLTAFDPQRNLALLKLPPLGERWQPIRVGPQEPEDDDELLAIGHPFQQGYWSGTVTRTHRDEGMGPRAMPLRRLTVGQEPTYEGGPLVDPQGRLVGLMTRHSGAPLAGDESRVVDSMVGLDAVIGFLRESIDTQAVATAWVQARQAQPEATPIGFQTTVAQPRARPYQSRDLASAFAAAARNAEEAFGNLQTRARSTKGLLVVTGEGKVQVNGRAMGAMPVGGWKLSAGRHDVKVLLKGQAWTETVEILPGATTLATPAFPKAP